MVVIREATSDDVAAYARLQVEEWDDSMAAAVEKIQHRIELFPEGVLVAEHDGEVVGCGTFIQLADYDVADGASWEDLTDFGWCSTHVPGGPVLFGVDLSVSRRAPRSTTPLMFVATIELAIRLGVREGIWGARMPRYHRYADRMTPQEYASMRTKYGRYQDPEIELYSKIPGVEMLGVVENYFKDWESRDNGVIFRWRNPVHGARFLRSWHRQIAQALFWSSRRRHPARRRAVMS